MISPCIPTKLCICMKKLQFLLMLSMFIDGCGSKDGVLEDYSQAFNQIAHINLYKGLSDQVEAYKLSDIADSIKFIPLEKRESSLLSRVIRVEVDGENIIVNSVFGQTDSYYFRYNMDGSFLNIIGKVGRGPGEYSHSDFSIDYEKKRIVVLRWYSGRDFISYSYDGEYLGRLPISPVNNAYRFSCLTGGRITVYRYSSTLQWPIDTNTTLFDLYDSTGRLTSSIPSPLVHLTSRPDPPKRLETPTGSYYSGIYRYCDEAFLYSMWEDTIYVTSGDSIRPAFILSKDKYLAPPEIKYRVGYKDNLNYLLEYLGPYLLVTDSLLFIEQHLGEDKIVFRYDKYARTTHSSIVNPTSRHPVGYLEFSKTPWFVDDLSGSSAQVSVREVTGADGSIIAMAYEANDFLKQFSEDSINGGLGSIPGIRNQRLKVLQLLSEDDNPVVVLIYLKKSKSVQ